MVMVKIIKLTGRKKAPGLRVKRLVRRVRRRRRKLALLAWGNPMPGRGLYIVPGYSEWCFISHDIDVQGPSGWHLVVVVKRRDKVREVSRAVH